MGNFLVIGGSGVMGQAAIKAVRKKFGNNANTVSYTHLTLPTNREV